MTPTDKRAIERARKQFIKERRRRRIRSVRAKLVHFKEYVLGFPWVVGYMIECRGLAFLWREAWEQRHWARATITK